jgi:hypothetical protein
MMNLVYNSDHFYVIEYQGQGIEVCDKLLHKVGFFQGDSAIALAMLLTKAAATTPDDEGAEDFLMSLSAGMSTSAAIQ